MPNENKQWWEECQQSLKDEHITIHNVMGTFGDLRDSRSRGFRLGTAEYVSFVDPDDSIIPGSFERCVRALDDHPNVCGVYTTSNTMNEAGVITGMVHRPWKRTKFPDMMEIHQLTVMRREHVIDVLDNHYQDIPKMLPTELWMYWAMAVRAPWLALNHIGYNWRKHQYGIHNSTTQQILADVARTFEFIKKSW
jgi:hypothetical protein